MVGVTEPGVPLPAFRSPSWTVNASSCLFMSAIRLGTPVKRLNVRIGQIAPEADGETFAVVVTDVITTVLKCANRGKCSQNEQDGGQDCQTASLT